MLLPFVLLALPGVLSTGPEPGPGGVFHGRAGELDVGVPRIAAAVTIDGMLNEAPWRDAALLTGFSQLQPTDQRPATDSTEVMVWYSPTAMYFGIRAFSPPGSVNARLSDRDKIQSDDFVQIILDTFNDGRQAFVFGVNALGVQSDGTINESQRLTSGHGDSFGTLGASQADLSANFAYESNGRVTEYGYEVEVRIPFKSLRYQPTESQDWRLQILRQVQHLGHQDTWTPARRDAASFLSQSGTLRGISGIRRGLVVDVNPSLVARQTGALKANGSWGYTPDGPEYGATLKWGVTNNLTLNGTVNPDFSQVEADVVAFQFDPRQALFYPERRPFFLEGIENFTAPNNLIYTRAISQPDVAFKLTGKSAGTNLAVLTALDDRQTSLDGTGHPFFNIVRAVRDIGQQSRLGLTYTDRTDGDSSNRVLGLDTRLVARKIWSLNMAGALSATSSGDSTITAPLWSATLSRAGRMYGLNARISAVGEDFVARAGFIGRRDVADYVIANVWNFYGPKGSLVETWNVGVRGQQTGGYRAFVDGRASQDRKLHFTGGAALRGGWRLTGGVFFENFGFDSDLYADYYIERPLGGGAMDTVKFTAAGDPRLHNVDLTMTIATPEFGKFSGDVFYIGGKDENFDEWQSGLIHFVTVNLRYRPTDQLRLEAQYQHQEFNRWKDGSTVNIRKVPRLKMEYQMSRSIFVRFVGQYDAMQKLDLRDDERTNFPILFRNADGSFTRASGFVRNRVRGDWLFSYQPTPGTVFFAGYGGTLAEPTAFRFRGLERRADGVFIKWSYLFRL
ncbi:MAG: hypothetical protein MNPFHGCM_01831 [Gemmatimonadaceae bacterium]|nr:hypothetical protein [Gemmatimonadaceae bacterium]